MRCLELATLVSLLHPLVTDNVQLSHGNNDFSSKYKYARDSGVGVSRQACPTLLIKRDSNMEAQHWHANAFRFEGASDVIHKRFSVI